MTNAKAAAALRQLLLLCASTCVAAQKVVGNYSCCFLVCHIGSNVITLVKDAHNYAEENELGADFRYGIFFEKLVLHRLFNNLG